MFEIADCFFSEKHRISDEFHIHVTWIPAILAGMTTNKTCVVTYALKERGLKQSFLSEPAVGTVILAMSGTDWV